MDKAKCKEKFDKFLNSKITMIVNVVMGALAVLFFFSSHSVLGFMGHYTFAALPYIIGFLTVAGAVSAVAMFADKVRIKGVYIASLCVNAFCFIIALAYFLGFSSNMHSMVFELIYVLIFELFAAAVVYLAFFHHKLKYKGRNVVAIVLVCAILGGMVLGFTDFNTLRFNYITEGAAVYAVGDDYQIVWRSRVKGVGWVEIAGEEYYDTYAGSMRSTKKVHKVTVPQEVLDNAGHYTVKSRALISEQSWSGLMGYTVKKEYDFRPVNTEDGIQTYAVSDVHDYVGVAKKALDKAKIDNLDFVILAGDLVNYLESEYDNARILEFAHMMSGGNIPVVFARGNHELKNVASEDLHDYVGAVGENYYFTFRLKNLWGIVLDMGEDHADDWYEFYGTARFDDYRAEQLEFVRNVVANADSEYNAEGVEYRIGVCHDNTAFVPIKEMYMYDALVEMNTMLNQMNLDVMVGGHYHQPIIIEGIYEAGRELTYTAAYDKNKSEEPSLVATGALYPTVLCSRRSDKQTMDKAESMYGAHFIGVKIELGEESYATYNNDKGEEIQSISPFEDKNYGKKILLDSLHN